LTFVPSQFKGGKMEEIKKEDVKNKKEEELTNSAPSNDFSSKETCDAEG
jgi:hypothetical protein